MHNEYDDEIFLGPEAIVSLHFDPRSGAGAPDWDISSGEALERAERTAWARHAQRASGFHAEGYDDEDRSVDLREAIRHVLTLSWD